MGTPDLVGAWLEFDAAVGFRRPETEADYLALIAGMDDLTDRFSPDAPPVSGLFGLLAQYIGDWEREHDPLALEAATPAEVLARLMRERGLKRTDLEGIVDQSLLSKILSGKRGISKRPAKALAERLQVSAAMFL